MISYEPLFATLEEKNVKLYDLFNDLGLAKATVAKLRKGESLQLKTIERICQYLGVPIEKVVRIDIAKNPDA